jgi:hypothetical protein
MEDGGDYNLLEVVKGQHNQPSDYFDPKVGARYYMLDDADAGVPAYKQTSLTASADATANVSASANAETDTLIEEWISPSTMTFSTMNSGLYDLNVFVAKTAGNRNVYFYWEFYEYKVDTSEVLITTSNLSEVVTSATPVRIRIYSALSADYEPSVGSRLVGKVYMRTVGGSQNTTGVLYYRGDEDSHWETPASKEFLDNTYLSKSGGTMTGNINLATGVELTVNSLPWLERADTNNQFIGVETSPASLSGATNNLCIGIGAGVSLTTGDYNICIGENSGSIIDSTQGCIFIGYNAGRKTTGNANTAIGWNSMYNLSGIGGNGVSNTTVGSYSGFSLSSGNQNVLIGDNSGYYINSGNGNVFIGYQSGETSNVSNKLYIENSNSQTPLIYGEFDNDLLTFNANVTIPDGKVLRFGTGLDGQIYSSSDDLYISNITSDKDIIFRGNDGGSNTDIMILDVSAGQLSGMQKAVSGVMTNAVAGTDYLAPTGIKVASFTIYDAGNSGSAKTIDWANGNTQKVTMTDNCTFTFSNPVAGSTYKLYLIQDAGGTNTHTWTGGGLSITWNANTQPTWITTGDAVNIAIFDYDGTTYRGDGWTPS